jgi:GNAT superfamily N-acetyltransferase
VLSPPERQTLLQVLAADFCCQPEDFVRPGVVVTEAEERPGRRRFPFRAKSIGMATLDHSVVICCDRSRLEWAQRNLAHLSRDDLFSAPTIAKLHAFVEPGGQAMLGPDIKFVCAANDFEPAGGTPGPDVEIELCTGDRIRDLYQYPGFEYAVCYRADDPRPDVMATVARAGGQVIGMAGASADCDCLWQVGINVVDAWQGRGIGRHLLSRLTQAILAAGKIPYYSTWAANIASQRLAASVGYRITWVELYAR